MRWPHHSCLEMHQSRMLSSHLPIQRKCWCHLSEHPSCEVNSVIHMNSYAHDAIFKAADNATSSRADHHSTASQGHLSQSLRAAGGLMPKLSPALAAFVSGVHAAFAFAAMSEQFTHLPGERTASVVHLQ